MIRVLNVMHSLTLGGLETTVMNYYRNINRSKVQFDFLITSEHRDYYEDEAISLGARVFRRPWRTRKPIQNAVKLALVLTNNPEIKIVHMHSSNSIAAIDAFVAALCQISVRVVHSHSELAKFQPPLQRLHRPLLRIIATHWVGCSDQAGLALFGERAWSSSNKTMLCYNARDLKVYRYDSERRRVKREELGIESNFALIHVARLDVSKNQGFLLEAFSHVMKSDPSIVLLMAGDGELRSILENQSSALGLDDCVRFLGQRDDIADLLQASDVFVLPSLYEGLPGAAIEAQAVGLPCLLSDKVSLETMITDEVEFLPITNGPNIWAERILSLREYERRNSQQKMRTAGYDILQEAKKLEEFYLQAAGR